MATPFVGKLDANHDDSFGHGMQDYFFGTASTAQRVKCALLWLFAEWFLDTSGGTPWFRTPPDSGVDPILGTMPANRAYAEATIKAAILGVAGVVSIDTFDLDVNRNTRAITVSASGKDADGNAFSVSQLSSLVAVNPALGPSTPTGSLAAYLTTTVQTVGQLAVLPVTIFLSGHTVVRVSDIDRAYWLQDFDPTAIPDGINVITSADGVRQWIAG